MASPMTLETRLEAMERLCKDSPDRFYGTVMECPWEALMDIMKQRVGKAEKV